MWYESRCNLREDNLFNFNTMWYESGCKISSNKLLSVYGNKCAQTVSTGPDAGQTRGKEDCLNLNIFRAKDKEGLLPVMVWIYGGAFVEGSNQEGTPDPLVEKGVMVVMINYR